MGQTAHGGPVERLVLSTARVAQPIGKASFSRAAHRHPPGAGMRVNAATEVTTGDNRGET